MTALSLSNIHKAWGKNTIIENLSLEIASGEFIVLVGPSGCGKSTLLRIIAGLEIPDGGKLVMGGKEVTRLAAGKRNLSMVFQSYALYPHMTVRENLSFGLRNINTPAAEIDKRVAHAASMLKLEEMLDEAKGRMEISRENMDRLKAALVWMNPGCMWPSLLWMIPW